MSTKNFYFVRHGKVDAPAGLYGRSDVPLSNLGLSQLKSTLSFIPQYDCVISSPLQRCLHYASLFSEENNVPLFSENRLMEMNFGDWDGLAFDSGHDQWEKLQAFWQEPSQLKPPHGESLNDFHQRITHVWNEISQVDFENIIVLTHGGVIRQIICHLLEIDWKNPKVYSNLTIDYASITEVLVPDDISHSVVKCIGKTF